MVEHKIKETLKDKHKLCATTYGGHVPNTDNGKCIICGAETW